MFDLSEQIRLPRYELKLPDGVVKSYDPLLVGYKLQTIEGEVDPAKIQECINIIFEIDVEALTAIQILEDFAKFSTEHLEDTLKKVLGRESSSITTSASRHKILENSPEKST